uniref:BH3-interacting domain death agonist n=1 Tax=Rhabditophanes sp. KR3021 TaxID=114890 RepID=A0AC35UEP5_9BILA
MNDDGGHEGGHLDAMTWPCIFYPSLHKLENELGGDQNALAALKIMKDSFSNVEKSNQSVLFDLSLVLLNEVKLDVNIQETYLRMQGQALPFHPEFDLQHPALQFRLLNAKATDLRLILSKVPDQMMDRRAFLDTIKEIASSIKALLDATNEVLTIVPPTIQQAVEKRKREFVHYSKRFSNTLKDYFRDQNAKQVSVSANQLIYQTNQIVRTLSDRIHRHNYHLQHAPPHH